MGERTRTTSTSYIAPYEHLETILPPLAGRALGTLWLWFRAYGTNPSPEQWQALRAILNELQAQADGTAKPRIVGSYLATGVGKTSAIAAFVRELVSDPAYSGVGVVILVSEYAQVIDLLRKMNLDPAAYAVRVTDGHELNEAGLTGIRRAVYEREKAEGVKPGTYRKADVEGAHRDAQVLITTQQKLDHMMRVPASKDYNEMSFFRYRDRPRQVRIWDEAIAPGAPITVTEKEVGAFATMLAHRGQQEAADVLTEWKLNELQNAPSGSVIAMPVWGLHYNAEEVDDALPALFEELERTMWWLEGREVRVHKTYRTTVLSYRPGLPHNFAPLLVLDASGAQSETYRLWPEMVELEPSAPKTYRNLTIRHWDHPASRNAHRDNLKVAELADAVCDVLTKVEGDVLVIYRKHDSQVRARGNYKPVRDIRPVVKAKCAERGLDFGRLKFVHWGVHRASNAYRDCSHFIVLGANLLPPALYEAMVRAAMGLSADDAVPQRALKRMREGDVKQHWLQAAGRSAIRTANGNDCPEGCTGWFIFSARSNQPLPRDLLNETFPGAAVLDWQPFPAKMRGGRLKTRNRDPFIEAMIAKGIGTWFEAGDFEPEIPKLRAWRYLNGFLKPGQAQDALRAMGYEVERDDGGKTHRYRLVPAGAELREAA